MIKIKNPLSYFSKKKLIAAVIVIAALLLSAVFLLNKTNNSQATAGNYVTTTVQKGTIEYIIEGSGTLKPSERYTLKTWSGGTVTELLVTEGSQVVKGQPLMTVKNDELWSSTKQASLEWELAQNTLNDMTTPLSEDDYDRKTAELKVEQYRIALEDYQEQKDKLVLKAPFDATFLSTDLKVGQRVNSGVDAARLGTTNEMEAVAEFAASDISSLAVGMKAQVYVTGLNNTYTGIVKEIAFEGSASSSSSTSGTFEVIISLDKTEASLRPGMETYNTVILANDPDNELLVYRQASGYLQYSESEDMVTEVAGTVVDIYPQPGDMVKKGDPIIRLKNDDIDRQVASAQNQLAIAQKDLAELLDPDADTIRQQELKVEEAYQKVLKANKKLESLNAVSPIDGIVTSIAVSLGDELGEDTSSSGQELLVVCNFETNYLAISVDELDVNNIEFGQEATITIDALKNTSVTGKVTGIAQEGTTSDGITNYTVTLECGYVKGIKAGMSATANILVEKKENVLRIPSEAMTEDGNKVTVQVLQNDQPMMKAVKTGLNNGEWVEITEGLQEGDKIIVAQTSSKSTTTQMMPGGGMSGPPPDGGQGGPPASSSTKK